MMALKDTDDTGEHQVIDPHLGGFRQSYELWVCHAQLPDVQLSESELTALLTNPQAHHLRTDDHEDTLTSRLDALRALSHLQWQWVLAPSERQSPGKPARFEVRATIQGAHAADVWFRPAARVTGWVRDDTVPVESAARSMTPVDATGWYVTQGPYRGERWVFATGESPEDARAAIDVLVGDEVNNLRHLAADIDSRRAALTLDLEARHRVKWTEPADGWLTAPLQVPASLPEMRLGVDTGTRVIERVELAEPSHRGRAVVAWSASEPERPTWRRLLDDTRTRVSAWASRVHWRR